MKRSVSTTATLVRSRRHHKRTPNRVVSSLTKKGAEASDSNWVNNAEESD